MVREFKNWILWNLEYFLDSYWVILSDRWIEEISWRTCMCAMKKSCKIRSWNRKYNILDRKSVGTNVYESQDCWSFIRKWIEKEKSLEIVSNDNIR